MGTSFQHRWQFSALWLICCRAMLPRWGGGAREGRDDERKIERSTPACNDRKCKHAAEHVMTAQIHAASVANTFLDLQAKDKTEFPRIDQMKLQKLLYYAQAWWLASTDDELFPEDIEAWPWGPVVRNIYIQFSDFGRRPISGRAVELVRHGGSFLDYEFKEAESVSNGEALEFLKSIWETHKHLSGVQLSNATHAAGEPWAIVKERYGSLDSKPTIPSELIRDVFRNKLASAGA